MFFQVICCCSVVSDSLLPHGLQHTRLPCPSPAPGVCLNSCPAQLVKTPPAMQETPVWFLDQKDPLEKGKATYFCILAWRIPWTEELGRPQSMGSQRVGQDWATFTYTLSQWCHPTISSSVIPFSCLPFFPASGSFPMSRLFTSGGQSIGVSASALVLPMNIQSWFPLGGTGLISLQSKVLSRVFSSTTVWRHQLFSTQSFLLSSSHICTWLLEKS